MAKFNKQYNNHQAGFTLMEIVVATAIFATVVAGILGLFNSVLRINRQVQATRLVAQTSRNFTEVLSREIRNGRIEYNSGASDCPIEYQKSENQALAMTTYTGEKLCFHLSGTDLILDRKNSSGTTSEAINPPGMTLNPTTFRFFVRPSLAITDRNLGIQPMVSIIAEFEVFKGTGNEKIVPYQSTISTDIYDIPNKND